MCALLLAASALVSSPARAQSVTASLSDSNLAHGVAINPVTNKIYLADYSGGTLTVIDGATNGMSSPSNTYDGLSNWAVAVNSVTNMVYLVDRGASKVYAFNGATATSPATYAATISPGSGNLFSIAVNPVTNMIYVADDSNGYVVVINGSTNTEVTTVSLGVYDGSVPILPVSVAVNPATNMIYVAEDDSGEGCTSSCLPNSVGVINGSNNTLAATVGVGNSPAALVVNPVTNLIYVANSGSNSVSVINGSTNAVTATVTSTNMAGPVGLAVNPVTNQVFVANSGSDYATVIHGTTTPATDVGAANGTSLFTSIAVDTSTNQVYVASGSQGTVGTFNGSVSNPTVNMLTTASGTNLEQIAVNPVTHKAYAVTNGSGASSISVIDGATNAVTTPRYPQSQPWALAVNPVTNTIFVADNGSNTVSVIDGSTNSLDVYSPITVGTNPNALVVDPINNLVYVSNFNSSSVSVINGASLGTPPSTISLENDAYLGFTPNLLAFNPVQNQVYGASTAQGVGFSFPGGSGGGTVIANSFFGGTTPIAIGVNPAQGYNYALFSDTGSLQVSDIHGGSAFPVCSGPTAADVNTVTNTIYVACGGSSGTLNAIQGADSFTPGATTPITLTNSSSSPTAVAVNPISNTIYVTDEPIENVSYLYIVSASNNNAVTTINLAASDNCFAVTSLAINIASNKIYLLCTGDDNEPGPYVDIFDGATNTRIGIFSIGTANTLLNEIAPNPVTGNIYALAYEGGNPGALSVYTENAVQSNSLTTTITPLTNNTTDVITPSFTFNTSVPALGVYFQVDSQQGTWAPATVVPDDNSAVFTGTASNLTPGFHILYAYATNGQDGSAANSGEVTDEDSPFVGAIASYGFLVAPPIATVNSAPSNNPMNFGSVTVGNVSASPNPILINNGGAASSLSYSYMISGPNTDEFVVDPSQSSCISSGGTLASNASCEIYVTFQPTGTGPATATLTWTDNSLGVSDSTQLVSFLGTGTASVTPPSLTESASNPSYSLDPTFSWNDTEANVTFQCSFTSGMTVSSSYSACTPGVNYPGLQENTWYTWSVEAVDSSSNVSSPITVTWQVIPSSITVTFAGNGSGSVFFNPPSGAIYSCTSTCTEPFDAVPVTLSASPNAGSTFAGWSNVTNDPNDVCTGTGSCLLVTVDEPQSVTATFNSIAVNYTLTVSELGTGAGDVTDNMSMINCGEANGQPAAGETSCSESYSANTMVTLTATPGANGSTFAAWGGACAAPVGTINSMTGVGTCNVTMSSAVNVTANFTPAPITVPVTFTTSTSPVTVAATFNCPGNPGAGVGNACATNQGANASAVQLTVQNVSSQFTVNVVATEVPPSMYDGICESNNDQPAPTGGVATDFDCRFLQFFNYGTDPNTSGAIVPFCVPFSNGNCIHYEVSNPDGSEPNPSNYLGPVNWVITWNNDAISGIAPGPYWTGSTPQLYDDPDSPVNSTSPYGTNCSSVMQVQSGPTPNYACQFEFDITTFYNPIEPVDSGIGGSTKAFNDVVVAWPPTSVPNNSTLPLLNSLTATTPSGGSAAYGTSNIGFTITLTNAGATTASGITLNDPLPSGPTWTLASSTETGCGISTGVLTCPAFTLGSGASATFTVSTSNAAAGTYSNVATFTIGTQQTSTPSTLTVTPLATALSNLSSYTITYGQSTQTITGTVSAGASYPPSSETVTVTIGSTSEPAAIGANGVFSVVFPTAMINASATPYPITYSYAGDNNFSSITNNSTSTLMVSKANQSITVSESAPSGALYGSSFTVAATASGGAVSYASSGSCSNSGATFTITSGSGSCGVAFSQAGGTNYNPATSINQSTPASKASSTATITSNSPNPSTVNQTVAVGVKVVDSSAGSTGTPTGSVTLTAKLSSTSLTCTATLSGGVGSCNVTPNATGSWALTAAYNGDGNFNTSSTASGTTQTVNAAASTLKFTPAILNFGTVDSGGTVVLSMTITNTGMSMVTFSKFAIAAITGDDSTGYLGVAFCPSTLNAGKSCVVIMSFTADSSVTKTHAANLVISDNASGSPQTIPMEATVIDPVATLSATSINFGTVKSGTTSAAKSVTLKNSGTTALTYSLSISGNFALASGTGACPSSSSLSPSASCTIYVTFTPELPKGSKSGSIKITDNALNSPQSISLSGTGD